MNYFNDLSKFLAFLVFTFCLGSIDSRAQSQDFNSSLIRCPSFYLNSNPSEKLSLKILYNYSTVTIDTKAIAVFHSEQYGTISALIGSFYKDKSKVRFKATSGELSLDVFVDPLNPERNNLRIVKKNAFGVWEVELEGFKGCDTEQDNSIGAHN